MTTLKALTIDFEPIEQSMRDLCRLTDDYYFHKVSGKVVSLSKGVIRFLTQESSDGRESLPDWDARMVPVARQIIISGLAEYVRIPEAFGQPEHSWMAKFARDVRSFKLRQKINQALRGRGACRRFKEIMKEFPEESDRWKKFRTRCWKEKIETWLKEVGILAIEDPRHSSRTTV